MNVQNPAHQASSSSQDTTDWLAVWEDEDRQFREAENDQLPEAQMLASLKRSALLATQTKPTASGTSSVQNGQSENVRSQSMVTLFSSGEGGRGTSSFVGTVENYSSEANIRSRGNTSGNKGKNTHSMNRDPGHWTRREKDRFYQGFDRLHPKDECFFEALAEEVKTKTSQQCKEFFIYQSEKRHASKLNAAQLWEKERKEEEKFLDKKIRIPKKAGPRKVAATAEFLLQMSLRENKNVVQGS